MKCGPSSTVVSNRGGLSGSTKMPDGSSVTVQAGNGVSSSSVATSGSSKGSRGSSAAASAAADEDCVSSGVTDLKEPKAKQQKR